MSRRRLLELAMILALAIIMGIFLPPIFDPIARAVVIAIGTALSN